MFFLHTFPLEDDSSAPLIITFLENTAELARKTLIFYLNSFRDKSIGVSTMHTREGTMPLYHFQWRQSECQKKHHVEGQSDDYYARLLVLPFRSLFMM